jgi:hypothetical protein
MQLQGSCLPLVLAQGCGACWLQQQQPAQLHCRLLSVLLLLSPGACWARLLRHLHLLLLLSPLLHPLAACSGELSCACVHPGCPQDPAGCRLLLHLLLRRWLAA